MKAKNLRAILRAPEVVQDLYREGLVAQAVAARMGSNSLDGGFRVWHPPPDDGV